MSQHPPAVSPVAAYIANLKNDLLLLRRGGSPSTTASETATAEQQHAEIERAFSLIREWVENGEGSPRTCGQGIGVLKHIVEHPAPGVSREWLDAARTLVQSIAEFQSRGEGFLRPGARSIPIPPLAPIALPGHASGREVESHQGDSL